MLAAGVTALHQIGEDLLGAAIEEAPLEEGTLRASGDVTVNVLPGGAELVVSFNTPYAARQHEEVTWDHPRAGKAKYLEDPLKERANRYHRVLGLAIGKAAS
jgi:hypothetical protein